MTTTLEKTLKRELSISGRAYILAISPEGLKLTVKGRRKGLELRWDALVSGDAALAVALNASIGKFTTAPALRQPPAQPTESSKKKPATTKSKSPRAAADLVSPPLSRQSLRGGLSSPAGVVSRKWDH
jgi:hypothetical protein